MKCVVVYAYTEICMFVECKHPLEPSTKQTEIIITNKTKKTMKKATIEQILDEYLELENSNSLDFCIVKTKSRAKICGKIANWRSVCTDDFLMIFEDNTEGNEEEAYVDIEDIETITLVEK